MVSECFRTLTVLPFRFGTIFDSDEALRRAVRANRKAFLESVDRLRGKAEMHFKLLLKDGTLQEAIAELPNGVGGEYLRQLRERATRDSERQTKARALSMQVHKLFSPFEEDVICKRTDSGGMLIDFAHLIDSSLHRQISKPLWRCDPAFQGLPCHHHGPWPPYHFMPGKLRTVSGGNHNSP